MHPQPSSSRLLLQLLCEQSAIPLDQAAHFLDVDIEEARALLEDLESEGCVHSRRFLVGDEPWYWPSRRGIRLADFAFRYKEPNVRHLAHRRAINAVRLYLARITPQGRWLSERFAYRQLGRGPHVPDAIFEIGSERHAIEVELALKAEYRVRLVLDEHSTRYNAVVYFCGPRSKSLLVRLRESGRWPNLRVFDLPKED